MTLFHPGTCSVFSLGREWKPETSVQGISVLPSVGGKGGEEGTPEHFGKKGDFPG